MQKILIISPTPTHPPDAGNRIHIGMVSDLLRKNNFDVHFLYLAYEDYDISEMQRFWGDRLSIIPRSKLYEKGNRIAYYYQRIIEKGIGLGRAIQKISRVISPDQYKYNAEVDSFFPRTIKKHIVSLHRQNQYNIVVCEYASMSKALTYFDDSVFKILDTHDKFTDRFKVYLQSGLKPDWVSLYRSQEAKAVRRANLVITLNHKEKMYFEEIGLSKSVCLFLIPEVKKLPQKIFEKKLLYFASANLLNIRALEFFETRILPKVQLQHPSLTFLVGGSICAAHTPKQPYTRLVGTFANAFDFYCLGDIVVNPELDGTGLKIKTLEALSYGLPVICTEAGAQGLSQPGDNHLVISATEEDFVQDLSRALGDENLRTRTKINAANWINEHKANMEEAFLMHLPR